MPEDRQPIYRIFFYQQDKMYEVYAKYLSEESLMGFIEIEELIFNKYESGVILDPTEEKLRAEFKSVKRSYIPMHSIIRIDEVIKEGAPSIKDFTGEIKETGNVSHLPLHIPMSKKDTEE